MTDQIHPSSSRPSLLPDTALNDPTLDRLDRSTFAESLATSIRSLEGTDSFAIGLCGAWGSGKTSVLNFLVSDLAKGPASPIVVKFNPWWFSGREQLLGAFLSQLSAKLQLPNHVEKAKKASKLLGTFSAALRPVSMIPVIGEYAKLGKEVIESVAGATTAYADSASKDVVAIREELDIALTEFPQRILIVMDDIDRLTASEIAQLFLILKAVADFPNTIYLLSFDHRVVTQAINEQLGVDGKAYLEKIIQLQIDVPQTSKTAIEKMFIEQLNEIIGADDLSQSHQQYFGNLFHDGLKHFLVTPRASKKLINMIRFTYPPLRGEVNVVDMIGISCLNTFAPMVIQTIAENPDYFTGTGPNSSLYGNYEREEAKLFHDKWLNGVDESARQAVGGIVQRLFPAFSFVQGGSGYSSDFHSIWQRELRVCSNTHFEKYFKLAIPAGTLSESEWKRFEDRIESESLDELIEGYTKQSKSTQTRCTVFLDRALLFAKTATLPQAKKFFLSLVRVGDKILAAEPQDKGGFLMPNNALRLAWVWQELLLRLPVEKDREDLIMNSIGQGAGIYALTELVAILGFQNGVYGTKDEASTVINPGIVSPEFIVKAAKAASRIVETIAKQTPEVLSNHPQFMMVILNWRRMAGNFKPRAWIRQNANNDNFLVRTIQQLTSSCWSQGMSDRVSIESKKLDAKLLGAFLSLKDCKKRCEKILSESPAWLTVEVSEVLKTAIYFISKEPASAKKNKKPNQSQDRTGMHDTNQAEVVRSEVEQIE